jgi:hypothetical protein
LFDICISVTLDCNSWHTQLFWIMNLSLLSASCTSVLMEFSRILVLLPTSFLNSASIHECTLFYLLGILNRGHQVEQFIPLLLWEQTFTYLLSWKWHLHCAGNICVCCLGDVCLEVATYAMDSHVTVFLYAKRSHIQCNEN